MWPPRHQQKPNTRSERVNIQSQENKKLFYVEAEPSTSALLKAWLLCSIKCSVTTWQPFPSRLLRSAKTNAESCGSSPKQKVWFTREHTWARRYVFLVFKNVVVFIFKKTNFNSVWYILSWLLIFYKFRFSLGNCAVSFKQPPKDLAKNEAFDSSYKPWSVASPAFLSANWASIKFTS